jgi:thymidylate kinase
MKIIAISGVDGSGKSTQVEYLKQYLKSQNKKYFYFHAIDFSIAKKVNEFLGHHWLTRKFIFKATGKTQVKAPGKSVTDASWIGIQLRKIFLRIDCIRFKRLVKKLEKNGYDFFVTDRYFYDGAINIAYLSGHSYYPKFIPKPDASILIEIDPLLIIQRDRVPEQGVDYLDRKSTLFKNMSSEWEMAIIDGNREREDIAKEIEKYVI